ncbi:MAG: LPXTG cell wall anchor domain-containing protein [[Clostridium] scindens]
MITDAEGLTAEGMSKEVKCTFSDQASASGNAGNGSNGKGNNGTNGSVKTGDEAQGILYLVVLLAALGAGTVVVLRRRARQF